MGRLVCARVCVCVCVYLCVFSPSHTLEFEVYFYNLLWLSRNLMLENPHVCISGSLVKWDGDDESPIWAVKGSWHHTAVTHSALPVFNKDHDSIKYYVMIPQTKLPVEIRTDFFFYLALSVKVVLVQKGNDASFWRNGFPCSAQPCSNSSAAFERWIIWALFSRMFRQQLGKHKASEHFCALGAAFVCKSF